MKNILKSKLLGEFSVVQLLLGDFLVVHTISLNVDATWKRI